MLRIITLLSCLAFTGFCIIGCNPEQKHTKTTSKRAATYTGSKSCASCHEEAYADWLQSDHYKAMLPATDSTVLGDFNDVTFTANGVTSRFFKNEGSFFINTEGEDGLNHDFKVDYVFGHYPLQQYLISFPGGRMQATRASWDSRENKWFNQYAGDKIHHSDWLHWTGNGQNWNTMCASCHSTNLKKNYTVDSDTYHTTWSEVNVGCESCHGPGSEHVSFMGTENYKRGATIPNSGLLYTKTTTNTQEVNSCAPCHARKTDVSPFLKHSQELLDDLIPQLIEDEFYFADGQIKEEDYVYGSFAQSKMYHNDVRCSNCHNPHSGKRIAEGNTLCMTCHEPRYNTPEHHFHKMDSEGAECIKCHMPVRTYMGNDHRRDHSFRVPRPDQSVVYGTPNTCNQCHDDKSTKWAAKAVANWYGSERAYHFSDDLLPGSLQNAESEKHLIKLIADTAQPEIARATAVHYLGNLSSQTALNNILHALQDQKAMVRYHALRALQNFPPETWIHLAGAALKDNVRAVRIAAAHLFHQLPADAIPEQFLYAYKQADAENLDYLNYQTDFAVGNVLLADYYVQENNNERAAFYYKRGLAKDSLMNYARLNLAAALNMSGKNQEALTVLYNAQQLDHENGRINYSLALLWAELERIDSAAVNFEKALLKKYNLPGVYYNYSLLLLQEREYVKAEKLLTTANEIHPQNSRLLYASCFLYLQTNQPVKARKFGLLLKQLEPNNPEYASLYSNLGI